MSLFGDVARVVFFRGGAVLSLMLNVEQSKVQAAARSCIVVVAIQD